MRYPIFWVALCLSTGIVLGKVFNPWILSSLPIFLLSFIFIFSSVFLRERKKTFWFLFLSGILFLGQSLHWEKSKSLKRDLPAGFLTLRGVIDSFPTEIQTSFGRRRVRFCLNCKWCQEANGGWKAVDHEIIVSLPKTNIILKYGDELLLKGEIQKSASMKNPGSFDPESYMESQGISGKFYVKDGNDFIVLSHGRGNPLISKVAELKSYFREMVESKISSPERGVVKAMLLGDREEIGFETRDDFSKSGTAHLLAISGLHVGLIASIFVAFLRAIRIARRWAYGLSIFLLFGYCILTGASASVLRSTIMITLYLSGFILKRESELVTSLSWAAILILVFAPLQLFDPGFQLSFLTVLFLGTLAPQWQDQGTGILGSSGEFGNSGFFSSKSWMRIRKFFFYLINCLGISFAAWVGILPVIAYYFFLFSPITIIANIFVVPYLWVVLSSGLAFLLFGSLSEFLKEILGLAVWFFTKILILMCHGFASVPFGHFRVSPPSLFDFVIFYGVILVWLFRDTLRIDGRKFLIIFLILTNIFVWREVFHFSSTNLKVTFLDVGHGDSALIEFPRKGNLLVDTGAGGDWDQGRMVVAPFLWSRGITHLDGILITHPDSDHCGGLKYLLDEFSVGTVFDNGEKNSAFYSEGYHGLARDVRSSTRRGEWRPGGSSPDEEIFGEKKLERKNLKRGKVISGTDGTEVFVLHPPEEFLEDPDIEENDRSLVFQLRYKNVKVLFTGDVAKIALQELSRYGEELESHVLKAPHHGSYEKEESEKFFLRVKPKIVIISEAEKNRFNLPSKKTVGFLNQVGTKIYQTGLTGAVEFTTNGSTYTIRTMLKR